MNYQRHPLEIGPLVLGLVFLGIVAAWSLFELDVISGADTAWILPVVLIGAGALGVVLAATRPRRAQPVPQPMPTQNLDDPDWMTEDPSATDTADTLHAPRKEHDHD